MTTRPQHPARADEEEPSASGAAAEPRSDGFAISPGIGPVPAIYVPLPPGQVHAGTAGPARRSRDGWPGPRLDRHLHERVSMGGTMPGIPADLRYSEDHLWARPGGAGVVRVGITDFAQLALG